MRIQAAFLIASLTLSVAPAFASHASTGATAAAAAKPAPVPKPAAKLGLAQKPAVPAASLFSRLAHASAKVGGWISSSFHMNAALKAQLQKAKEERKQGDLRAAALTLTVSNAPKAHTLFERFRVWRANKAVIRASRFALAGSSTKVDPSQGQDALDVMRASNRLSLLDKGLVYLSKRDSGLTALDTAKRLGNAGKFDEALKRIEWAQQERGQADWRSMNVSYRLYRQAMKASEGAAKDFARARTPADQKAAYEAVLNHLGTAYQLATIRESDGTQGVFEGRRLERLARRMGVTSDVLAKDLNAMMSPPEVAPETNSAPASHKAEPKREAKAKSEAKKSIAKAEPAAKAKAEPVAKAKSEAAQLSMKDKT